VGLGLGRQRLALGTALGLTLTFVAAAPFGAAALANDHALRATGAPGSLSHFGPTDPSLVPPTCSRNPRRPASAHATATAHATLDEQPIGTALAEGDRQGGDEAWQLQASTEWSSTRIDFESRGGQARVRRNAGDWVAAGSGALLGLDTALLERALSSAALAASEDFGFELVGGARARHCRIAIDGATALESFAALRILAGQDILAKGRIFGEWRGTLDYWVFGDGELGVANATISGLPGGIWPRSGLRGVLNVRLEVTDRDVAPEASAA
jgi:hypothetical protein